MRNLLLVGLMFLTASGCNAVFVRETERFSLSIEGKPDATEPVSGNFGYKQRVAIVIPGRKKPDKPGEKTTALPELKEAIANDSSLDKAAKEAATRALGEAVSVISYYDMVKTPDSTKWLSDPVEVRTAFITGDAASALSAAKTQRVAKAISGASLSGSGGANLAAMKLAYDELSKGQSDRAKALRAALDGLASLAPKQWPVTEYDFDGTTNLTSVKKKGDAMEAKTFADLLQYANKLESSQNQLVLALKSTSQIKLDGSEPLSPSQIAELRTTLDQTKAELKRVTDGIVASGMLRGLLEYYRDYLMGGVS
jgi:hypothetical protein